MKFLPPGASKFFPPLSPEKCLLARKGGGGGIKFLPGYFVNPSNHLQEPKLPHYPKTGVRGEC